MDQKIFSFNAYKHHLLFVRQMIKNYSQGKSQKDINSILDEIRQIGNNVMDLYTGNLIVAKIIESIERHLYEIKFSDKKEYKKWLKPWDYKTIELSDHSMWVLRLGLKDEAYIHIHPARYGAHITRLTGGAWKTALTTAIFVNKIPGKLNDIIDRINYVRVHFLELSPVKKIIPGSNLDSALKLLKIL